MYGHKSSDYKQMIFLYCFYLSLVSCWTWKNDILLCWACWLCLSEFKLLNHRNLSKHDYSVYICHYVTSNPPVEKYIIYAFNMGGGGGCWQRVVYVDVYTEDAFLSFQLKDWTSLQLSPKVTIKWVDMCTGNGYLVALGYNALAVVLLRVSCQTLMKLRQ